MTSTTTKPDSLQPAADLAGDLFDNWFDPLEAEVRARSREFIEQLLRGELEAALSRPRYGRSPISGREGSAGVAGHRHGSGNRTHGRESKRKRKILTASFYGRNRVGGAELPRLQAQRVPDHPACAHLWEVVFLKI
jgi:hypothetical protein